MNKLEDYLLKISGSQTKVNKEHWKLSGDLPVISQDSTENVKYYVNRMDFQPITDLPLVVFGDHTCVFKYIDFEFVRGADGTQLLKPNHEFNGLYFYYLLVNIKNIIPDANKYQRHFKYLKKIDISKYKHDLKTQKNIASVLSSIDKKIELNKRINAEMEALAKTLYDYWFVQFDFPDKNGKPYKTSGGKMIWNEQLKREIPEGWRNSTIEMVIDKQPNAEKLQTHNYSKIGSIPIIDQSQDYICGYTDSESAIIIPAQPHVIFGDHTRVVKLVNFKYARGADGTQVLVPKTSNIPGYLLYQIVSTIDLSNYGYARHFKFLKESKIVIPSESIAQQYSKYVSALYALRTANIIQNRELSTLRDWLLPMLMNGQVKVN